MVVFLHSLNWCTGNLVLNKKNKVVTRFIKKNACLLDQVAKGENKINQIDLIIFKKIK